MLTGVAVALWAVASALIPVLATATAARCLRAPVRPRYRPQAWAVVFPLGMYAMAGLQLGTAARLPLIHHIGAAAVWPAAAAWAVTLTAMAASPFTGRRRSYHPPVSQDGYRDEAIQIPGPGQAPPRHDGAEAPLPGPTCRMVVRARHRKTGASKLFSTLVTSDDSPLPGNSHIIVTLVVLGDDAGDYLNPGERFVLWRGYDVGRGVVTRRIFV